jgi:hypothetical protein
MPCRPCTMYDKICVSSKFAGPIAGAGVYNGYVSF